jgi:carboxypeptidase Taq
MVKQYDLAGDFKMKELEAFKELVGEIQDLGSTQGLLGWDLETMMPEKGSEIRAKQLSTLSKLSHEMMISDKMGQLLKKLREPGTYDRLDKIDKALVREVGKDYDRATKIPVTLVQEMTEITTKSHKAWVEARLKNRFDVFAPYLEKIIDLNRQMAKAIGYKGSPYNALLDLYEPDLTTDQVDILFAGLKKEIVPLVKAIAESKRQPETRFLKKNSSLQKQQSFSEDVIRKMGFDFEAGRLDKAPHPFCMGMGPGDVRLTTRFFKNDLISSLFSSMHEAGHGMYEQGTNPALMRTPLGSGASLGIHESQSRLWENLVGRSRPFWKYALPKLRKLFPQQLQGVTLDKFYAAINRSQPSLIRVEADEVTYNLHIMLRYEIERDLIEGKLQVKDLPRAWNQKMKEYLGLTPETDTVGVLQDIHWSHGSFGYFPTYTLGNLYAAQFFHTAKKKNKALEDEIARGNLKSLKAWLNKEIHWVSKVELPNEIVQRVTGEPLNSQYFVDYLWGKFGEIYALERPAKRPEKQLASIGKR